MKRTTCRLCAGAFAAVALLISAASCCNGKADEGQLLQIGDDIAIAQTQYGKIQGYRFFVTFGATNLP